MHIYDDIKNFHVIYDHPSVCDVNCNPYFIRHSGRFATSCTRCMTNAPGCRMRRAFLPWVGDSTRDVLVVIYQANYDARTTLRLLREKKTAFTTSKMSQPRRDRHHPQLQHSPNTTWCRNRRYDSSLAYLVTAATHFSTLAQKARQQDSQKKTFVPFNQTNNSSIAELSARA